MGPILTAGLIFHVCVLFAYEGYFFAAKKITGPDLFNQDCDLGR